MSKNIKKFIKIIFIIAVIAAFLYIYNAMFDIFSYRIIYYVFYGVIILIMLYFSLKQCWEKK